MIKSFHNINLFDDANRIDFDGKFKDMAYFYYDGDIIALIGNTKELTLELSIEIIRKRSEIVNGKPFKLLVANIKEFDNIKVFDKESREYFMKDYFKSNITAIAICPNTSLGKFLALFFINVSLKKLKIPKKQFSKIRKSVDWLKSQ